MITRSDKTTWMGPGWLLVFVALIVTGTTAFAVYKPHLQTTPTQESQPTPLGSAGIESRSMPPGATVGNTWHDEQHKGRMPRMVDWGYDVVNGLSVHFLWTDLESSLFQNSKSAYNFYYTGAGGFFGEVGIQPDGDYAGYVALDVTDDNRAVVGCNNDQGSGERSHFYWDFCSGCAFFGLSRRVTDSVVAYVTGQNWIVDSLHSVVWPDFCYQEVPGQTPVTHVFALTKPPSDTDPRPIAYFRKVGDNDAGYWDYPPYVVDTVFGKTYGQSVACSNTDGKIALVWIAGRPDEGDVDTASSQDGTKDILWDNDLYYQISYNYGVSFSPRVNLTKNQDGEAGYRPFTDVSPLIDGNNDLHIAWNGRTWPADASSGGQSDLVRCRMFHWGENLGTGGFDGFGDAIIRTAASLEWDQPNCDGGKWQLNGSKMSLSECNGKLYYLWTQFNDPANGILDDCAARGGTGAANGELFVTISDNGGLTWCQPMNLTNSYSPGCDSSTGVGGPCYSEHWSSMAKFGHNLGTAIPDSLNVDPSGMYTGTDFLEIQYILDEDAGSAIEGEGSMQEALVRWMRLACIDPPSSIPPPAPWSLEFPAWTPHGVQLDTPLVLQNFGNVEMTFTLTAEEDTGPSGWLTTSGFESGIIPAGYDNSLEGVVSVNTGGIVNAPGTVVGLSGRLILASNASSSPDTFPVECWVTDTLVLPEWDTIFADCQSLAVSSEGTYGAAWRGHANLDYFACGDCDTVDTIPGMTEYYLYDGSPVICWPDGDSVVCNYSACGIDFPSSMSLVPMGMVNTVDSGAFEFAQTFYTTRDSSIMFETNWYGPSDPAVNEFVVQWMKVYATDGEPHLDLAIGEVTDWDIPSDSFVDNAYGFDDSYNMIFQTGVDYGEDAAVECQPNSDRYGGMSQYAQWLSGGDSYPLYAGAVLDLESQVYPTSRLEPDSLWKYMGESDYTLSDNSNSDLLSLMTYQWDYDLYPGDTLNIITILATSKDGGSSFYSTVDAAEDWVDTYIHENPVICQVCGDIGGDGIIGIDELIWASSWPYLGAVPYNALCADLDGHELYTWHDVTVLWWCIISDIYFIWPQNEGICPPSQPPYGETARPDIYAYPGSPIMPAGASTITCDMVLSSAEALGFINIPMSVRVGGEIPAIDFTIHGGRRGTSWPDSGWVYVSNPLFGGGGVGAGNTTLATMELTVTPSGSDRAIVLEPIHIGPMQNGRHINYPYLLGQTGSWTLETFSPVCVGYRGNIDNDPDDIVDIADLVYLVDYMFSGGPGPACWDEADVDGSGGAILDVGDLVYLVDYMFSSGPVPPDCP